MARKLMLLLSLATLALSAGSCAQDSVSALAKIQREKIAYIGTVPFEPPLLYQRGGELVGPDADLARLIVDEIAEIGQGTAPGDIRTTWLNRSHGQLTSSLANREFDFVVAAFAITEERKQSISFSKPYYTSELVMIINPSHRDLRPTQVGDARVGVREASGVGEFVEEKFPQSRVVPFKTLDDAALALRRGEVDSVVDDRNMANYALATLTGVGHMEVIPEVLGRLEFAVGVRRDDQALLDVVDGVIERVLSEDQYAAWLGEHVDDEQREVEQRQAKRLEVAQRATQPRQVVIRVSKDDNFQFDIYRLANLSFILRNQSTGQTFNTSRIDFQGRVGVASVSVPPGMYTLSLPRFNLNTPPVQISSADPSRVGINIRITGSGNLVVSKT